MHLFCRIPFLSSCSIAQLSRCRPLLLLLVQVNKLQELLRGRTISKVPPRFYLQRLKKDFPCHQQVILSFQRNLMKRALFDDLKACSPLTDPFNTHHFSNNFTLMQRIFAFYAVYYNMGGDRRGERRSRSRDRSREKEKKRHRRREFSSSEQRGRERHRKHKSHHRHHNDDEGRRERQQHKDENAAVQEAIVKEVPCWEPSGILLQFYNSRDGVSLKFHEPPQSRPPIDIWKIYVFKGDEVLQPIELNSSCFLIGKDERICDILCLNPSISRQHAVIQFRLISKMNIEGDYTESIKPYVMDLGSTNGTFLNDEQIEFSRYYELLHKDVLRFGHSDRLYVMVKDEGAMRTNEEE